jgi:hypothetical protein
MNKTATRSRNTWPAWKLRAFLPDRRRWSVLRLVQLTERGRPWQFQTFIGTPAVVGLFASREAALAWAKTHCDRVDEEALAPTSEVAALSTRGQVHGGLLAATSYAGALRPPDPGSDALNQTSRRFSPGGGGSR